MVLHSAGAVKDLSPEKGLSYKQKRKEKDKFVIVLLRKIQTKAMIMSLFLSQIVLSCATFLSLCHL